jgi:chromosome segregation ATPase
VTEELATERTQREDASRELGNEREISARALAERDELAREAEGIRARQAEVQNELAESRRESEREREQLRQALEIAEKAAARREKRAAEEILSLGIDLDRVRERLEKARSDYSELRISHALLFTEIAETRADAGRSSEVVGELQAELERLQGQLSELTGRE